jgi:hypothetical protein
MTTYTYQSTLAASEKAAWKLDDVLDENDAFDFGRPFLPESLARASGFPFLSRSEAVALNQIRGHAYLSIFGLVEEFILPFVLDHARPHLSADDWRTRALMQFAGEEAKHIQLFRRFRQVFERGFGDRCDVIGPADQIAKAVLAHDPLGVALAILQIEWMTQRHYIDSVKSDEAIDPRFKKLLRHHWMEESQHAKLDTLMVEALAHGRSLEARERGIEAYLAIGKIVDGGLVAQVDLDLSALERRIGRTLDPADRATFREVQLQANRWTYLGSGMTHPRFLESVAGVLPSASLRIAELAPAFGVPAAVEA